MLEDLDKTDIQIARDTLFTYFRDTKIFYGSFAEEVLRALHSSGFTDEQAKRLRKYFVQTGELNLNTTNLSEVFIPQKDIQITPPTDPQDVTKGPKYQINIQHAQGLAIGDGARVIQYPASPSSAEVLDTKLDAVLAGQATIRDSLAGLQQDIMARFNASEQAIIAQITRHLDQAQLVTVEGVLEAIDSQTVTDGELQDMLTAVEQALVEIHQLSATLSNPILVSEAEQVSEAINIPNLDVRHRLKVTLPIIPLLLSYEGEVELNSGLNLEASWQRLVAKIKG